MEERFIILSEAAYNAIVNVVTDKSFKEVAQLMFTVSEDIKTNSEKFSLATKAQEANVAETPEAESNLEVLK